MSSIRIKGLAEALFEEAGDALYLLDPENDRLLSVNAMAEKLSGFTRLDLKRMPATHWFRYGGPGRSHSLRDAASKSDVFHSREGYQLRTMRGEWIPVNLTISRLHVQPKTLALITARDIREQRQAFHQLKSTEEQLRKVNSFLHSIVENVPLMLFVKDAENLRFELFNRAGEELLGRRREELLGKNDFDFFPKDEAAFFVAKDREVLGEAKLILVEETIHTHRGERLLSTRKIPILAESGKPLYLLGISEDITERKALEESRRRYARDLEEKNRALEQSERRYRQLLEGTSDAIVVADGSGLIQLFNPAAVRIFGYRAEEIIGQSLLTLVPEKHRPLLASMHARGLQSSGPTFELDGLRKDSTEFPLELAISGIDIAGSLHLLASIRDTTERQRMSNLLIQNEKLASIGRLSAGVAHELNNPLSYVSNNLNILKRDVNHVLQVLDIYERAHEVLAQHAPGEFSELQQLTQSCDLGYIRENLGRMLAKTCDGLQRVSHIVHSLRGFARSAPVPRQQSNLSDLIDDSIEMIQDHLQQQNIQLVKACHCVGDIMCVPSDLVQVLVNLLENAAHAIARMPDGHKGIIRIRTEQLGTDILIEVADNGCGMNEEVRAKVFDPFFTTKNVGEGMGLGLWITHSMISAHGGRLEVASRPEEGSRFRIYLPIQGAGLERI